MKEKHIRMYMEIAEVMAKQSYAERLKVGAVIVRDHRILSVGYNGTPHGMSNVCEELYEDIEYVPTNDGDTYIKVMKQRTNANVIHAEMNTVLKLARDGESGKGADFFITHSPCFECSKALLTIGIKKVYYRSQYRSTVGIDLLTQNGVEVEHVS